MLQRSHLALTSASMVISGIVSYFAWCYHRDMAECEMIPSNQIMVATAYHEAGHAVMALLLNMPLDYVTIRRCDIGSNALGLAVFKGADVYRRRVFDTIRGVAEEPLPDYEVRMFIENHCVMLLAGVVAEYLRFPHSNSIWKRARQEIAHSDMNRLMGWLSRLHAAEEDTLKNGKALLFWAKRELCKESTWAKVSAVAETLLKEGRLSCERIQKTMALHATVLHGKPPTPCRIDVETGKSFEKKKPQSVYMIVGVLVVVCVGTVLRNVELSGNVMGILCVLGCITILAFFGWLDAASRARRCYNAAVADGLGA